MKKTVLLILALTLTVSLLASCQPADTASGDISSAVSAAVTDSNATCTELRDAAYAIEKVSAGEIHYLYSGDSDETKLDEFMCASYYGTLTETPDLDAFQGYAIFITDEPTVSEFGIFKANDEAQIKYAEEFCARRLAALIKKFEGYKPEMVTAAKNAFCKVYGNYVYYIATVSSNSDLESAVIELINTKAK